MSRSIYSEDGDPWAAIMWGGQLASAIRGKRGQAFLADLVAALEAMPEKRLIANELRKNGEVCALGALGTKRGIKLESIDPDDYEEVAATFDIAHQLCREVVWQNDDMGDQDTPEQRWHRMHEWAKSKLKSAIGEE